MKTRLHPLFLQSSGRLRAGWRIGIYAAVTALFAQLALAVYHALAASAFASSVSGGEEGYLLLLNALLWAAALGSAFVVIRVVDRRPFRELGFALHGRVFVELAQGVGAGFVMIAPLWAVEAAAGWAPVEFAGAEWGALLRDGGLYLATFTCAAALEETLARGYVFQALVDGAGRVAAVAATSVLFGLGHVMNPHVGVFSMINTMLAGAWLAAAYLKTRSLWLPTALHLSWNFFMAYLFGFAVSGLRVSHPVMRSGQGGPEWVTGGAYGPEGGLLCTIALLLSTAWILASRGVRPSPGSGALWMRD